MWKEGDRVIAEIHGRTYEGIISRAWRDLGQVCTVEISDPATGTPLVESSVLYLKHPPSNPAPPEEYKKGDRVIYAIGPDEYEGIVKFIYEHRGMPTLYIADPVTYVVAALASPDTKVRIIQKLPPPPKLTYYPSLLGHKV